METIDFTELPTYPITFYLVATYGEGEPTDNALPLDKWLDEGCKAEESGTPFVDV